MLYCDHPVIFVHSKMFAQFFKRTIISFLFDGDVTSIYKFETF